SLFPCFTLSVYSITIVSIYSSVLISIFHSVTKIVVISIIVEWICCTLIEIRKEIGSRQIFTN
ncbi:hypothetical protein B6U90_06450, partial [Thermoplasmatales archaeon ex4484_6]